MKKIRWIAFICVLLSVLMLTSCMVMTATLSAALLFGKLIEVILDSGGNVDTNAEVYSVGDIWAVESIIPEENEAQYSVKFNIKFDKIEKVDGYTISLKLSDLVLDGDYNDQYLTIFAYDNISLKSIKVNTSNGFEYDAEKNVYEIQGSSIIVVRVPLSILEEDMTLDIYYDMETKDLDWEELFCFSVLIDYPTDTELEGLVIMMQPYWTEK